PRTAVAGVAGKTGLPMALSAISRTLSVRFTTATPVAETFRKVVVSRKGLRTMTFSSHSTPMGAKLGRPSGSSVVTIDSMMKGIRRHSANTGSVTGRQVVGRRYHGASGAPVAPRGSTPSVDG